MNQLLIGVITAVIVVWCTQLIESYFKRQQHRQEKLLERYSEFISIAITDLQRAKEEAATMVIFDIKQDTRKIANDFHSNRMTNQLHLQRLSFLIRIDETHQAILELIELLVDSQPFMAYSLPPHWNQGNFNARANSGSYLRPVKLYAMLVKFVKRAQSCVPFHSICESGSLQIFAKE